MADTYFVGLRSTDDVVSDEKEGEWRKGIMRLFPNGSMPLTALTSMMKSEKVTDPLYHWWDKTLTSQKADVVTGQTYVDAALSTSYTPNASAGATLYFKIADVKQTKMFRQGHTILMRDASELGVDFVGTCVLVVQNGTSSVIGVTLLEDDDNGTGTGLTVDTLLIIGNANAQGATRPTAISQSPSKNDNYCQIFRDSLDMSRTMMRTKGRSSTNFYDEAKRDTLEQHGIGMEKAFLWGIQYSGTGSNGEPIYYTKGLLQDIKASGTVQDFVTDSAAEYTGQAWIDKGTDWIEEHLEEIFRYGSDERLCLCGSGALLGIQKLVRELGMYTLSKMTTSFGFKVLEWLTPFGAVYFKTHPLFSFEASDRYSMVLFEPKNITFKYIDDTFYKPDLLWDKGGSTGKDGKEEEYLTEGGLEFHFPLTGGYLTGVGKDNTQ